MIDNLYANTVWQLFLNDHPIRTHDQTEIFRAWCRKYIAFQPLHSPIARAVRRAFA